MNVFVDLNFDGIKDDIRDAFAERLERNGCSEEKIEKLLESFDEQFEDAGFLGACFEVELNDDETQCVGLYVNGGC